MELILKPTGRCNFNCKFCSAAYMNISHNPDDVPTEIRDYINATDPTGIIVTGGEPLMMSPEYFYKIHDIAGVGISITSNLKDFYLNPDKWKDLFMEDWFGITTSFQYGDGRMWDTNTVYTEEMFLRVVEKFREVTGKNAPIFIAVIGNDNEKYAIDHVLLAKQLGTKVRLNNMIGVGKGSSYPRYKMMRIYSEIIDRGLDEYEVNCIERFTINCPRNIIFKCENAIRCIYIDESGSMHVGVCDERLACGQEFDSVDESIDKLSQPYLSPDDGYVTDSCIYCDLCRLCNGCKINRLAAKKDPNYCTEMMKIKDDIFEKGWML